MLSMSKGDREEHSANSSSGSFFAKVGLSKQKNNDSVHSAPASQKTYRSARVVCYEDEMRKEELSHVAQISSLEFIIEDTLAIGFLKFYCELQFNVENIYFIVEVGMLRDLFMVDAAAWGNKDWKAIDHDVGLANLANVDVSQVPKLLGELHSKKIMWPSNVVSRTEVEHKILWMWNTFFSASGTHEICVPSQVLQNTIKRIFLLHIYGPKAFEEALIDPLKTLKRDIYPRFIVSELASEMTSRLQGLHVLPTANMLSVAPPAEAKICAFLSEEKIDELINTLELSHALVDSVLYGAFMEYLQSIVSAENLLCIRMIEYFKELAPETMTPAGNLGSGISNYYRFEAVNQAWLIYLYFVHPGSAYEVALSHRRRKEIRLMMANPVRHTFDRLEKSAMDTLRSHFTNYRNSSTCKSKLRLQLLTYLSKKAEEEYIAARNAKRLESKCVSCCCICS